MAHGHSPNLPNCEADGFQTQLVLEKNWFGSKVIWHAAQTSFATRDHCDVMVFSGNIRYLSLVPGLRKARRNGVATVLWGHHRAKSGGKAANWIRQKYLFPLADTIVCYSHAVADQIREQPDFRAKTFVAPNAIDQTPVALARQQWLDSPEKLQEFKTEHDLATGPNLLFVSRIKPRNKLEIMLDVLTKVAKKFQHAKAIIVGAHNDEQKRIEKLAQQSGLENRVLFPGAIYDQRQLAPWFLSSDIFLYPSQIGLSLFHAFGYGLPVVAGEHPENQNPELEALEHGKNGFRFTDGDTAEATDCILQILENEKLRHDMSQHALSTVENRFNIDIMAEHFVRAIRYAAESLQK